MKDTRIVGSCRPRSGMLAARRWIFILAMAALIAPVVPAQALTKVADLSAVATGSHPMGDPFLHNGALYFTCSEGGFYDDGTLCRFDLQTGMVTKIADLYGPVTGSRPEGDPYVVGNTLYFTCSEGGAFGDGTLCGCSLTVGTVQKLVDLQTSVNGRHPNGGFAHLGNELFFLCRDATGVGNTQSSLVRYDFASTVTRDAALDLFVTGSQPFKGPAQFLNELYFTCGSPSTLGTLVRRNSNGTLTNLGTGSSAGVNISGAAPVITPSGVYFTGYGTSGIGRWTPAAGMEFVNPLNCQTGHTVEGGGTLVGNDIYFTAAMSCGGCIGGVQDGVLFRHTIGGATVRLASLGCPMFNSPAMPSASRPRGRLVPVNQDLYFTTWGGGNFGSGTLGRYTPTGGALASSMPVGPGCGAGTPPLLAVTGDPHIGYSASFAVQQAVAGAAGALFVSVPPVAATPIGGGCSVYLDIPSMHVLSPFTTSGGGTWFLSMPIPNELQLVGFRYRLQAGILDGAAPLGLDLTNGIEIVIGH